MYSYVMILYNIPAQRARHLRDHFVNTVLKKNKNKEGQIHERDTQGQKGPRAMQGGSRIQPFHRRFYTH